MNYLGLATVGTVIASTWSYIGGIVNRLRSYIIVSVSLMGHTNHAMQLLLWTEFQRKHIGDCAYQGRIFHVRPANKKLLVGFETLGKSITIFWKGWKPIFVRVAGATDRGPNAPVDTSNDGGFNVITIYFLRWHYKADELLVKAIDLYNKNSMEFNEKTKVHRFFIHKVVGTRRSYKNGGGSHLNSGTAEPAINSRGVGDNDILLESGTRVLKWNKDDIGEVIPESPFAALDFPPYIHDVISEIKRWKESEKWFRDRQISWKRGYLLYSIPGCGKTSLVRAIGQSLDMPIYIFDLSTMTNEDLNREWSYMISKAPVICLFEDFDGQFDGRKSLNGEDGVTYDCLLNNISGCENSDGVLTFVTTNDITKIDPAMGNFSNDGISSRPGRLDRIIELKQMTINNRISMAKRILVDCLEEVDKLVKQSDGYTPAQFQELCTQVALKNYWKDK